MQSSHPDGVSVLPQSPAPEHLQEPPQEPADVAGTASVCKLHHSGLDSSLSRIQNGTLRLIPHRLKQCFLYQKSLVFLSDLLPSSSWFFSFHFSQFLKIFDELADGFEAILAAGHMGVMVRLVESCVEREERQVELLQHLLQVKLSLQQTI